MDPTGWRLEPNDVHPILDHPTTLIHSANMDAPFGEPLARITLVFTVEADAAKRWAFDQEVRRRRTLDDESPE